MPYKKLVGFLVLDKGPQLTKLCKMDQVLIPIMQKAEGLFLYI